MQTALIFILLLTFVLGLGLAARRLDIPYPIFFVMGGLVISFLSILPKRLELDPDFFFFLVLPPLLYIQAFYTSWRDFNNHIRSISALAIGLVLVNTVAVAFVAHWIIPDFPLAAGLVLGAIVSPPDAIAASAIARRLGLPRRVVTILEGESLVNDATSLVLFKLALASLGVTMGATRPMLGHIWVPGEAVYISVGGVAVGLLLGRVIGWLRRRIADDGPQIALTVSLLTPYLSYFLADQFLHVSGVLAVVATGLFLGWESPEVMSSEVRLQAQAFWQIIIYLLNGIVFVLIGLQLPDILHGMREYWWPRPFCYAIVINLVCIVVRMAWVFPGAYLPWLLSRRLRAREKIPDWRQVLIIGWSGMRGIVSLAAALVLLSYPTFERPHLVIFLTFSVIFTSLVLQGLTLPPLIRWLGVGDDGIPAREEVEARNAMSTAVFDKFTEVRREQKFPASALDVVESFYRERAMLLEDELADQLGWSPRRQHALGVRRLNRMMIAVQRRALLALRRTGKIGDDVMHKLEHQLDLEEARLSDP